MARHIADAKEKIPLVARRMRRRNRRRRRMRDSSCQRSRYRRARGKDGPATESCWSATGARSAVPCRTCSRASCFRCASSIASLPRRMRSDNEASRLRVTPGTLPRRLQNSLPGSKSRRASVSSDDKRRGWLAVDRGHFPDAFARLNRNPGVREAARCPGTRPTGRTATRRWCRSFGLVAAVLHRREGADLAIRDRFDDDGRLGAAKQCDRVDSRLRAGCAARAASRAWRVSCRLGPAHRDREMVAALAAAVARDRPRSCESTAARGLRAWLPRGLPGWRCYGETNVDGSKATPASATESSAVQAPWAAAHAELQLHRAMPAQLGPPCLITFASASSRQ